MTDSKVELVEVTPMLVHTGLSIAAMEEINRSGTR